MASLRLRVGAFCSVAMLPCVAIMLDLAYTFQDPVEAHTTIAVFAAGIVAN